MSVIYDVEVVENQGEFDATIHRESVYARGLARFVRQALDGPGYLVRIRRSPETQAAIGRVAEGRRRRREHRIFLAKLDDRIIHKLHTTPAGLRPKQLALAIDEEYGLVHSRLIVMQHTRVRWQKDPGQGRVYWLASP